MMSVKPHVFFGLCLCVLSLLRVQAEQPSPLPVSVQSGALSGEYHEAYYVLDELNAGLEPLVPAPNLQTPQACLEFFVRKAREGDFAAAAHALNFNLFPRLEQRALQRAYAEKLLYLLEAKELLNFADLPDRPDGQVNPVPGSNNPMIGQPRRSVQLGSLDYQGRALPLRLQRVRVGEAAPLWVFSANTTENIDALYSVYGPGNVDRMLPDWLNQKVWGVALWEYLAFTLLAAAMLLLGWLLSRFSRGVADSLDSNLLAGLLNQLVGPLSVTLAFGLLFAITSGFIPGIDAFFSSLRPLVWIIFVSAGMWLGIRSINYIAARYRDYGIEDLTEKERELQGTRLTLLAVARQIFVFLTLVVGLGVMLSQFTDLGALGTMLLTSAGIAGAIIGIAAQPTLGNIIASIQVAVTRPLKIGDTIIYQGEWSTVEDLHYTYGVIKTWDSKRFIVPMRHFITETVENWSHTELEQAGAVYLYLDFHSDVDDVRAKCEELARASSLWIGNEPPEVLVVEASEACIKVRCRLLASNPDDAWELECKVREALLRYISQERPQYLPRNRVASLSRGAFASHHPELQANGLESAEE